VSSTILLEYAVREASEGPARGLAVKIEPKDMRDKYGSFSQLAAKQRRGADFRVRFRNRRSNVLVIAPHGGGIEPGTSETAVAIAGHDLSFYAFEGIRLRGNGELHITSTRFDEPRCVLLVQSSQSAISIHGEDSLDPVVYIGGRDAKMMSCLRSSLTDRGFRVKSHRSPALQGIDPTNICNRTISGGGVQLELSKGLRRSFFQSLSKSGRRFTTERFDEFVGAVREALCGGHGALHSLHSRGCK
jgi:phage replication-related protein YjqB (UPF0714/DUF867 family)